MPIYALGERTPDIHPDAYVHPDAVLIGDVRIRADASVWPGAVLRGDSADIEVGARTSIQDGTVVHATDELPTMIGEGCVVGHIVHLEGCIDRRRHAHRVGLGRAEPRAGRRRRPGRRQRRRLQQRRRAPDGARALGVPAKITEGAVPERLVRATPRSTTSTAARSTSGTSAASD